MKEINECPIGEERLETVSGGLPSWLIDQMAMAIDTIGTSLFSPAEPVKELRAEREMEGEEPDGYTAHCRNAARKFRCVFPE